MDKKKKAKKNVPGKNIHLITDINEDDRDTQVTSFDSIESLENYLVDELQSSCGYNFDDGNDIVIRGEILNVKVTETTYKVKIK